MLHVKLQESPGVGILSYPSEQVIIPLLGLVSGLQETTKMYVIGL